MGAVKDLRPRNMPFVELRGNSETPGSTAVTALEKQPASTGVSYISKASGATVPTLLEPGFLKNCIFQKTGETNGIPSVYINIGDEADCNFVALGTVLKTRVAITNAQMLALRATPKTLVAAPGAGLFNNFLSAVLFFDATGAYTETADNMAVKLGDGSGTTVSEAIESTGFIDQTTDQVLPVKSAASVVAAKAAAENKALVLHNAGDGEFGGGNAANEVVVETTYQILATGF